MVLKAKLDSIIKRYAELEKSLMNPAELGREKFVACSKEYANLGEIVPVVSRYIELIEYQNSLKQDIPNTSDKEMLQLMQDELEQTTAQLEEQMFAVKTALIPKEEDDEKNVILEVRSGTGGDEAALFAADLFRMYVKYAERQGWRVEIMSITESDLGGYKDASASITGKSVYGRMKFESGVHRVQRVPQTESGGRIHTSAATVAILPEAEEVDVKIEAKDIKVDVYRAGGPGGQSVNTTDSAVRLTHIPTGIVVIQQDEKSQHKNKAKAMKILCSRLYAAEKEKVEAERSVNRKTQVGSGDRSERVRTYNFPQGRVTDHRINMTLYSIDAILKEGALEEFTEGLLLQEQADKLENLDDE